MCVCVVCCDGRVRVKVWGIVDRGVLVSFAWLGGVVEQIEVVGLERNRLQ